MFTFAMCMSLCVDVMVMSSGHVVRFIGACGVGVVECQMYISLDGCSDT